MCVYTCTTNMKLSELKNRANFMRAVNSLPPNGQMHLMKHLDDGSITFLNKCLASLVNGSSRHLKLKRGEQKLAQTAWLPYKKQLKRLSSEDNHGQVLARIKKQTGEGVMFTALLSAAIPLITNLIELIVGGKKKKRERKRPAAATAPAAGPRRAASGGSSSRIITYLFKV